MGSGATARYPAVVSNPVHPDLASFIRRLEEAGSLLRITAPVSPVLEITEIVDRHSKARTPVGSPAAKAFDPRHADLGGQALLFESVEGSDFPLAINLYGSYARTEMALGCHDELGYESIASRLAAIAQPQPPRGEEFRRYASGRVDRDRRGQTRVVGWGILSYKVMSLLL